ncbi:MAG: hypothetical protein ACKOC5_17605 [Chloroflexota bacterium]
MIAMVAVFFLLLILFGFIGAARGWAKEVLVVAAVILAMAVITLLEDLLKLGTILGNKNYIFYLRMIILISMVFFGYQSPRVQRIARATEKRAMIGERILSFLMGMISGFFVIGTLWYFATEAGFPGLENYITPASAKVADTTVWVMNLLPPVWLDAPIKVFIALVVIFVFVIIYFV